MEKKDIQNQIEELVKQYFSGNEYKFVPGETKLPLNAPTFGADEVNDAIESLLTTWVTMGKKVYKFEELFSNYIGTKYSTMVNSGSSANLLALAILANPSVSNHIKKGEEVIAPAVTWSTTIWPIADVGAIPVLVDIDTDTFSINLDSIEAAITDKTRAIMPVHLLGMPCDMKAIMEISEKHGLYVVEDCCEAHGAEFEGKKVGSFGDLSAFSFFFSHHITTMEGGMVLTNNEEFSELSKPLRAHGWIREMSEKRKDELIKKYSDIDKRFFFINSGFNVRPTDLQGAFGIHQIKKLEDFIEIRRVNADFWTKRLEEHSDYFSIHKEKRGRSVWFGYPITIKPDAPFKRKELVDFLESKNIETRPIMAGNVAEQPAIKFVDHKVSGDLKNSKFVMRNSFFFGNHQGIGKEEREYIADCFDDFIKRVCKK